MGLFLNTGVNTPTSVQPDVTPLGRLHLITVLACFFYLPFESNATSPLDPPNTQCGCS